MAIATSPSVPVVTPADLAASTNATPCALRTSAHHQTSVNTPELRSSIA